MSWSLKYRDKEAIFYGYFDKAYAKAERLFSTIHGDFYSPDLPAVVENDLFKHGGVLEYTLLPVVEKIFILKGRIELLDIMGHECVRFYVLTLGRELVTFPIYRMNSIDGWGLSKEDIEQCNLYC
jgi:hypothetical protein